jgi:hypothetical protein
MNKCYLTPGLVCYWQDHGFHGTVAIRKFNKKYVQVEKKIIHIALSKFLEDFQIYDCDYGSFHKNIGKILSLK